MCFPKEIIDSETILFCKQTGAAGEMGRDSFGLALK